MENLASAGFTTTQIMQAMPGMLDLAASSGEDLATSADIAASTLNGFGLAADQAGHVADVLAKNASATNAAVRDTGEAMKYIAPVAQEAGWSLESVTAAIGEMANSGIKGSSSGTTLRSMFTSLVKPSKEAADAMESMGFKAYDSNHKMKSLSDLITDLDKATAKMTTEQKENTIATLFGQEAMSGILTLIKQGSSGLDTLTDSYKNSDGAASEMAKTMQDNAKSSIEQMVGSLETAAIVVEETFAPKITELANYVQDLANKFADLSPEQQEFYLKLAAGAMALGPVTKGVGALTQGVSLLMKMGGKVTSVLGGAAAAESALGEGAAGAGALIGTTGVVAGVALASISAFVIGLAGVVTYNELLSKSVDTSTDQLNIWEKAVNAVTGSTIKSKAELQKAGLIYKDFGEGVSDSFKKGIEKATDEYHNLEILINQSNLGDKITEANQGKITGSINKIIDEAKTAITSRKGELQKELVAGMTVDGSGVSENEQKVLDIFGRGSDEKLAKITEIQGKITETWDKAIKEHGKLSSLDVEVIQNYVKQIERVKAEATAKNEAESTFAENNFMERLTGLSSTDASKEYTDASKTIKDNYVKLKATYKTEEDDLALQLKKSQKDLENAQSKEQEDRAKADILAIQQEMKDKNDAYDKAAGEEKGKRRKLLDMLYEKNPTLKGSLNEITGTMFSTKDSDTQKDLKKIESTYAEVANATETGLKHIQDVNGKWHDIYVTVDEGTGNITSAIDINAKKGEAAIGGYSEAFEKQATESAKKAKESMKKIYDAFESGTGDIKGGKVKLQGDSLVNVDTNEAISKFDTIITKADKTKVAIANINGTQVKIEFDDKGVVKNVDDVKKAVEGLDSNAKIGIDVDDKDAVEKFKKLEDMKDKLKENGLQSGKGILIDGKEVKNIDEVITKLESLPRGKNIDLKINGEEVTTIDGALDKLSKLPKETNTKIIVNGEEIATADEAIKKFEEIKQSDPNAKIIINGEEISTIEEADRKLRSLPKRTDTDININVNTSGVGAALAKISGIGAKEFEDSIQGLDIEHHYTGSNGGTEGLTYGNEHGWEISTGEEAIYRMGSGSSIADHMTSVNEMNQEISQQVGDSIGRVVNTLVNGMSSQNSLLAAVAQNTGATANITKESVQVNKKIADDLLNKMGSTSGTFGSIQSQIDSAKTDTENANNMKAEDTQAYNDAKAEVDRISDMTSDAKKALGEETLKIQKDNADKALDSAKKAAELDIIIAKQSAEEKTKIAEENKNKLIKIAEATSNAIKNKLTEEKEAADKVHSDRLKNLEDEYNAEVAKIDKSTKKKTDAIDAEIKALEEQTNAESRADERKASKDKINVLNTKKDNTKSQADKDSIALQIANAQKELNNKESGWNVEDQKAVLEEKKTKLTENATTKKDTLKKEYDDQKAKEEEKLKATDEYYSKLLETDSLNAQTRYKMLTSSSNELVSLLNSYAPGWQDAGQSLGDSLLTGLNSSKQSVQDAINDMVNLRGSVSSSNATLSGYATGTSYNPTSGLYNVDENKFETANSGSVAYVSKGASINNHMQSMAAIKQLTSEEVAKQVALMRSSLSQMQAQMQAQVLSNVYNSANNSKTYNDNGQINLHVENLNNYDTKSDIGDISNELGSYRQKQKKF